jgi:hypothetical protein
MIGWGQILEKRWTKVSFPDVAMSKKIACRRAKRKEGVHDVK